MLYNHKYVSGQGFFSIDKKNVVDEKSIYTVITKPSQGIIFHPLMLHRSVPRDPKNLRPRYTVDIRYFDTNYILCAGANDPHPDCDRADDLIYTGLDHLMGFLSDKKPHL